jgi:hypothetical protein
VARGVELKNRIVNHGFNQTAIVAFALQNLIMGLLTLSDVGRYFRESDELSSLTSIASMTTSAQNLVPSLRILHPSEANRPDSLAVANLFSGIHFARLSDR